MSTKQTVYYLGNMDLVQEMNVEQSQSMYFSTLDKTSKLVNQDMGQSNFNGNLDITQKTVRNPPIDLGLDVYNLIRDEYVRRNQNKTNSALALFETWKILKKKLDLKIENIFKQSEKQALKQARSENFGKKITLETQERLYGKEFKTKSSVANEKMQLLEQIAKFHPDNVLHTLKIHQEQVNQDFQVSQFIGNRLTEIEISQSQLKKQKGHNQEAVDRLLSSLPRKQQLDDDLYIRFTEELIKFYQNDFPKKQQTPFNLFKFWQMKQWDQKSILNIKSLLARENLDQYFLKVPYVTFTEEQIRQHKLDRPSDLYFRTPEILLSYWKQKTVTFDRFEEDIAKDNLEKYFYYKIQQLFEIYKDTKGFETSNVEQILQFWQQKLSYQQKKELKLDFENQDNLKDMINLYLQKNKDSLQEFQKNNHVNSNGLTQEQQLQFDEFFKVYEIEFDIFKTQNKFEMNPQQKAIEFWKQMVQKQPQWESFKPDKMKKLITKFLNFQLKIQKKREQEQLFKSQDPQKIGKTLLQLKKMFPEDKILTKMICDEFSCVKTHKYPQEYDCYDSDQENQIKMRSANEPRIINGKMTLYELERPQKEKESEIYEMFASEIEAYYDKKTSQNAINKQTLIKDAKDDRLLERYINQKKKGFFKNQYKRFDEKIPSLNQYLSQIYHECLKNYKSALIRKYPHPTYGESKSLKKKSYSLDFKRAFFISVKSILRKTLKLQNKHKRRLPFWAPPSMNQQRTHNKTVYELSREAKQLEKHQQKVLNDPKTKYQMWNHPEYLKEKQRFLMTFSDAKECTFKPQVMIKGGDEKLSIGRWVKEMGKNLGKKFKMVYKFGCYRRALLLYQNKKYTQTYKKLLENFYVNEIKKYYDDKFTDTIWENYQKDPNALFSFQNLNINKDDLERYSEDFSKNAYKGFYFDVYKLIFELDQYEMRRNKTKQTVQKKINSQQNASVNMSNLSVTCKNFSYNERKNIVKNFMCPLKDNCPDLIAQRWPVTDIKTTTTLGSNCIYAHHLYELKFKEELRQKKKLLKSIIDHLDSQNEKPNWNPGGAQIAYCIGCPDKMGKPGSKGICGYCELIKTANAKVQKFQVLAKIARIQKEKHKEEQEKKKNTEYNQDSKVVATLLNTINKAKSESLIPISESENKMNQKIGILQRAQVLYTRERYTEAFEVLSKAIEIVYSEMNKEYDDKKTTEAKYEKLIGINKNYVELTAQMVYQEQAQIQQKKLEGDNDFEFGRSQKITNLALRTGIIGDQKPNINQFINNQIENLYRKIEKKLSGEVHLVELMKKKLLKLDLEEEAEFNLEGEEKLNGSGEKQKSTILKKQLGGKKRNQMCPDLLKFGYCQKFDNNNTYSLMFKQSVNINNAEKQKKLKDPCPYAHAINQLDRISKNKKKKDQQKSIQLHEKNLTLNLPQKGWRGSTQQSTMLTQQEYDEREKIRKLKLPPPEEVENEEKKSKNEKISTDIWSKPIETLLTNPLFKKQNQQ